MLKIELLKGEKRGKGNQNASRREGFIPAVIYGNNDVLAENIDIKVPKLVFEKLLDKVGEHGLIELSVEDIKYNVLVREVQKAPVKGTILHIDFICVNMDREVIVKLPLNYVGEAPVVKKMGGIITSHSAFLKIRCLPGNLIDSIEVDLSGLEKITSVIKASDIELPDTVKLVDDPIKLLVNVAAKKVVTEKVEGDADIAASGDEKKEEAVDKK